MNHKNDWKAAYLQGFQYVDNEISEGKRRLLTKPGSKKSKAAIF